MECDFTCIEGEFIFKKEPNGIWFLWKVSLPEWKASLEEWKVSLPEQRFTLKDDEFNWMEGEYTWISINK